LTSGLTSGLGPVFVIDPEREMGMPISLMGLLIGIMTMGTTLNPSVRKKEAEVPDEVPENSNRVQSIP